MDFAFQAEGLVKRFGKKTALSGLDLAATAGTVLGVLGPNGAGKTTAIRILATLMRPDEGRAVVGGFDVVTHPSRVRRLIGLTGQYATVDEELTAFENLVMVGQLLDMRKAEAGSRADELLRQFDLQEAGKQRASVLSGGMRRRLDLAVSLVGRPQIVFLDEPTTGLDPGRREDLWRLVRTMTAEGVTVLLTTQYLEEADALADHICVIDEGRAIADGTPADLKQIVGGQAIVVRPVDPQQTDVAVDVLEQVAGRRAEPVDRGVVTVPVDDDRVLPEVIQRLAAADIRLAEFSLRLPSLDEAFFALTGRSKEARR
ncbi:daunorubicin resistance protein DrrA family ABC transporter ATP-binding protein [Actinoplanes sp. NBRC 14428]|uniref:Oleandomycin transport system ATP-binding protein n=1 Tax=Pseudosporangium ferrugineum TaxID=439699 RepID=A0A2T0RD21_9ACTN|nr:ATP-binding cassette domain-containing protein [Pseudosporangium ferrugineum]PRY19075.1 oleandomycin transport system ATP-binding protein [Pseudosporangium ferrugineum]BCJ53430.1 daunorubicin resistance protein DrrA family ABC transporter ATP-binding protein [Actinoplanes sp. NBRC 14428]